MENNWRLQPDTMFLHTWSQSRWVMSRNLHFLLCYHHRGRSHEFSLPGANFSNYSGTTWIYYTSSHSQKVHCGCIAYWSMEAADAGGEVNTELNEYWPLWWLVGETETIPTKKQVQSTSRVCFLQTQASFCAQCPNANEQNHILAILST